MAKLEITDPLIFDVVSQLVHQLDNETDFDNPTYPLVIIPSNEEIRLDCMEDFWRGEFSSWPNHTKEIKDKLSEGFIIFRLQLETYNREFGYRPMLYLIKLRNTVPCDITGQDILERVTKLLSSDSERLMAQGILPEILFYNNVNPKDIIQVCANPLSIPQKMEEGFKILFIQIEEDFDGNTKNSVYMAMIGQTPHSNATLTIELTDKQKELIEDILVGVTREEEKGYPPEIDFNFRRYSIKPDDVAELWEGIFISNWSDSINEKLAAGFIVLAIMTELNPYHLPYQGNTVKIILARLK